MQERNSARFAAYCKLLHRIDNNLRWSELANRFDLKLHPEFSVASFAPWPDTLAIVLVACRSELVDLYGLGSDIQPDRWIAQKGMPRRVTSEALEGTIHRAPLPCRQHRTQNNRLLTIHFFG